MNSSGAKRFSRDVAVTLAARLFIAGGSFLSGIIVARWLGAESVGIVASLNAIALLAVTFGAVGMPAATTYMVASDNRRARRAIMNALVFALSVGTLLAGLICILYILKPELFGNAPGPLVFVTSAIVPFQLLSLLSLAIVLALGRIGKYNLLDMLTPAALVINPLVILVGLGSGLYQLIIANAAAVVVISIAVALIVSRMGEGRHSVDAALAKETLKNGSRFYLAMISAVVVMRSDLLFVNYFRGSVEAGVYSVATQVGTLLIMIPTVISTVLFPKAAGAGEGRPDLTSVVTRHSSAILFVICLAAVPGAFLLPVFFGTAFADSVLLVIILLPGIYFLGLELVLIQYFNGLGLPWPLPLYWGISMISSIVLNLVFTPRYGAVAAASISTITYTLLFVLVAFRFCKVTGTPLRDLLLLRVQEIRQLFDRRSGIMALREPAG